MKSLLFVAVLISSFGVYAFDAPKYFQKNCKSCHSLGAGDVVGPDLAGLHKRRKIEWTVKFVNYPDGMINGDAEEPGYEKVDKLAKKVFDAYKPTVMPEFILTKAQVQALYDYIKSTGKVASGKIVKIK